MIAELIRDLEDLIRREWLGGMAYDKMEPFNLSFLVCIPYRPVRETENKRGACSLTTNSL